MATWSTQTATREYQIASNGELTVVERLANLLETGQFADVTINVGEGDDMVTFKAHRLLLATASKSLNNLVSSNLKNGPGEEAAIKVTDVDPDAFQHLLKYIYTDDLKINNAGECVTLLKLGKEWELQNLVGKTINYVHSFLDEYEPKSEERKNELCELVSLAEEFDQELQEKCWNVLMKNVNEVVPCQGFLNMSKERVKRLLNHQDFHFKDQLMLFEAIRDWGMNQVLQNNLNVNSLKGIIGEFLDFIDFKSISDSEVLDTIIPSDCLGKAELISLFMTRGLAIPRDLSYNNNNIQNEPYEKSGRYEKGFKLSNQEVYKEHELRFRVDKKLRLLGVGFGFLFSNTDMGITVHCQGPWEVRQWQDIIQTYCRVTYEKMKTADVRLMFSEPVTIEANHSYKILVRVGRMSAGTSDVELWGGTQGTSRVKIKDAEISFLKAAVHPSKQVEDSDTENKPGMITDLIYELDDGQKKAPTRTPTTPTLAPKTPTSPSVRSAFSPFQQRKIQNAPSFPEPTQPKKKSVESSTSPKIYTKTVNPLGKSTPSGKENVVDNVAPPESQIGSMSASNYSFRRNVPSARVEINPPSPTSPKSAPPTKKTHVDEASSYYLTNRPSNIRGSETLPSYMRNRRPSVEKKQSWCIPSRPKTVSSISSFFHSFKNRPSKDRDIQNSDTSSSRRSSKPTNLFENTSLSKSPYNYGISNIKSKYETRLPNDASSRNAYEIPSRSDIYSRYGTSSQTGKPESRYSTNSQTGQPESRYASGSQTGKPESRYATSTQAGKPESRYATSNQTTNPESRYATSNPAGMESRYGTSIQTGKPESRYAATGSGSHLNVSSGTDAAENLSVSRYGSGYRGRERTSSPSRYGRTSPSLYGQTASSQNIGKDTGFSRSSGISSPPGISRHSTTGSSTSQGTSRYGTTGTSTPQGTSRYGASGTSSSLGTSRFDTTGSSSSIGTSRYGTPGPSSSLGTSRFDTTGSSSSIGTSRYGTPGPSSSLGTSSRYGSSASGGTSRYGSGGGATSTRGTTPSRYGSTSSSANPASSRHTSSTVGSTGIGSRYSTASSSTPSYLSSSRFGTSSPIGNNYNSSSSNRFGTALYRR